MSFWENTRKPVGLGGKLMVSLMNLGHSPVAWWGLRFLNVAPDAKVLDLSLIHICIEQAVDQLLRLEAARRGQHQQNRERQTDVYKRPP